MKQMSGYINIGSSRGLLKSRLQPVGLSGAGDLHFGCVA